MTTHDELNTPAIAVVGFLGAILVFATIVLLLIVFYREEAQQHDDKDLSRPPSEVTDLVFRQQSLLVGRSRWMDQEKGIVGIPIDRAMKLVVDEISRDPEADSPEAPPPADAADPAESSGVAEGGEDEG